MREKIQNTITVTVDGLDLTQISDVEFYVKQYGFSGVYTPEILSETEMLVTIPFEDAVKLRAGTAKLQFAYRDSSGAPQASDAIEVDVGELLKEAGYDPI